MSPFPRSPLFLSGDLFFIFIIPIVWFEAFPIVFSEIHHFNLGLSGLPFIGITTGCVLSYIFYCFYTYYYYNPKMFRGIATGSPLAPESRLYLAVFTGFTIPISLFLFGLSIVIFVYFTGWRLTMRIQDGRHGLRFIGLSLSLVQGSTCPGYTSSFNVYWSTCPCPTHNTQPVSLLATIFSGVPWLPYSRE